MCKCFPLILLVVRAEGEMVSATKTRGQTQDKHYAEATALAIEALQLAKKLKSGLNKSRVQHIYIQLSASPYKEEPAVARLGLMLKNWRTTEEA